LLYVNTYLKKLPSFSPFFNYPDLKPRNLYFNARFIRYYGYEIKLNLPPKSIQKKLYHFKIKVERIKVKIKKSRTKFGKFYRLI